MESLLYVTVTTGVTQLSGPPFFPLLQVFQSPHLPPREEEGDASLFLREGRFLAPVSETLVPSGRVSAGALRTLSPLCLRRQNSDKRPYLPLHVEIGGVACARFRCQGWVEAASSCLMTAHGGLRCEWAGASPWDPRGACGKEHLPRDPSSACG